MRNLILITLAIVNCPSAFAADPAPDWKLSKQEAEKWVERLKQLSRDGWTITAKDNAITIERNKATAFVKLLPNSAPNEKPMQAGERKVRYMLRFAPRMTTEEYEKLATVNEASSKEYDRLHAEVKLPHKFDDFIATTPEEKARVQAFRNAVARLPRHTLPDLYTPEYSIFFYQTGDDGVVATWIEDKDVKAECDDVRDTLLKYFGMYNPRAAAGGMGFGQYLSEPPQ